MLHMCDLWPQCLKHVHVQGMDQLGPTLSSFPDWIYNDLDKAWVQAWRQRPGPRYTLCLIGVSASAGHQWTAVMLRVLHLPGDLGVALLPRFTVARCLKAPNLVSLLSPGSHQSHDQVNHLSPLFIGTSALTALALCRPVQATPRRCPGATGLLHLSPAQACCWGVAGAGKIRVRQSDAKRPATLHSDSASHSICGGSGWDGPC